MNFTRRRGVTFIELVIAIGIVAFFAKISYSLIGSYLKIENLLKDENYRFQREGRINSIFNKVKNVMVLKDGRAYTNVKIVEEGKGIEFKGYDLEEEFVRERILLDGSRLIYEKEGRREVVEEGVEDIFLEVDPPWLRYGVYKGNLEIKAVIYIGKEKGG